MTLGYWLVKGDKTSCGGVIKQGTPRQQFGGHYAAMNGYEVSCGQHPGTYRIAGGHPGDWLDGNCLASTLYSRSTCPCKARFIPSQTWASHGLYRQETLNANATASRTEPEPLAQAAKTAVLPSYLMAEPSASGGGPDYSLLRNTRDFPDKPLRDMLSRNNQDVMFLTLSESFEVLQS